MAVPTTPATARSTGVPATVRPWLRLAALALVGAIAGALVAGLLSGSRSAAASASASLRIVPDAQVLGGPLLAGTADGADFVAGELAVLDDRAADLEATSDGALDLTVSRPDGGDVVRVRATADDADDAQTAVTGLVETYAQQRRDAATATVQADLDTVQERLDELGPVVINTSPLAAETQRLLGRQSELLAALARVPDVAPVVRAPAVDARAPDADVLLPTVVGAVVGAVLLAGAGGVARLAGRRLHDVRRLEGAAPVLLPRLPAGRTGRRTDRLPEGTLPTPAALAAARLLAPQVLGHDAGPRTLLVAGASARSGAPEVAWELACGVSSGGAPVAVLAVVDEDGTPGERLAAPELTVVDLPQAPDDETVAAVVRRQVAAGRHVVLLAPDLSADLDAGMLARHADRTVVVVGEGRTSLEESLAAVRIAGAAPRTRLVGVVATTTGHWNTGRPLARALAPADDVAAEQPAEPGPGVRAPV
jgi:hypothetical protein